MSNPSVCAVCLVNGRHEMVARAVASFRAQTYQNKRLLIWDTGELNNDFDTTEEGDGQIVHIPAEAYRDPALTIGALRNEANGFWNTHDIICHFDSDDWSHPRRIEEQVALLQASGKECVGYRDMLFWRERHVAEVGTSTLTIGDRQSVGPVLARIPDEAWLYTGGPNYCLGTSLCYWRSVWEKRPFEDLPKHATGGGEDTQWLRGVDHLGVTSMLTDISHQPRMVASIHGSNTSSMVSLAIKVGDSMMKRVPAWDDYCRTSMELK